MTRHPPPLAILLGLGGLVPFVACGLGALTLSAEEARLSLLALLAYGATVLAFLGGVHWGFALDEGGRTRPARFSAPGWCSASCPR